MNKKKFKGFSMAEAVIALTVFAVVVAAATPFITRKIVNIADIGSSIGGGNHGRYEVYMQEFLTDEPTKPKKFKKILKKDPVKEYITIYRKLDDSEYYSSKGTYPNATYVQGEGEEVIKKSAIYVEIGRINPDKNPDGTITKGKLKVKVKDEGTNKYKNVNLEFEKGDKYIFEATNVTYLEDDGNGKYSDDKDIAKKNPEQKIIEGNLTTLCTKSTCKRIDIFHEDGYQIAYKDEDTDKDVNNGERKYFLVENYKDINLKRTDKPYIKKCSGRSNVCPDEEVKQEDIKDGEIPLPKIPSNVKDITIHAVGGGGAGGDFSNDAFLENPMRPNPHLTNEQRTILRNRLNKAFKEAIERKMKKGGRRKFTEQQKEYIKLITGYPNNMDVVVFDDEIPTDTSNIDTNGYQKGLNIDKDPLKHMMQNNKWILVSTKRGTITVRVDVRYGIIYPYELLRYTYRLGITRQQPAIIYDMPDWFSIDTIADGDPSGNEKGFKLGMYACGGRGRSGEGSIGYSYSNGSGGGEGGGGSSGGGGGGCGVTGTCHYEGGAGMYGDGAYEPYGVVVSDRLEGGRDKNATAWLNNLLNSTITDTPDKMKDTYGCSYTGTSGETIKRTEGVYPHEREVCDHVVCTDHFSPTSAFYDCESKSKTFPCGTSCTEGSGGGTTQNASNRTSVPCESTSVAGDAGTRACGWVAVDINTLGQKNDILIGDYTEKDEDGKIKTGFQYLDFDGVGQSVQITAIYNTLTSQLLQLFGSGDGKYCGGNDNVSAGKYANVNIESNSCEGGTCVGPRGDPGSFKFTYVDKDGKHPGTIGTHYYGGGCVNDAGCMPEGAGSWGIGKDVSYTLLSGSYKIYNHTYFWTIPYAIDYLAFGDGGLPGEYVKAKIKEITGTIYVKLGIGGRIGQAGLNGANTEGDFEDNIDENQNYPEYNTNYSSNGTSTIVEMMNEETKEKTKIVEAQGGKGGSANHRTDSFDMCFNVIKPEQFNGDKNNNPSFFCKDPEDENYPDIQKYDNGKEKPFKGAYCCIGSRATKSTKDIHATAVKFSLFDNIAALVNNSRIIGIGLGRGGEGLGSSTYNEELIGTRYAVNASTHPTYVGGGSEPMKIMVNFNSPFGSDRKNYRNYKIQPQQLDRYGGGGAVIIMW